MIEEKEKRAGVKRELRFDTVAEGDMRIEAGRCENTTWLFLKMDKGMMNQGMQL